MFDTTHDQMNNWRWDNPCAFDAHVDCSNLETTSSGKGTQDGKGKGKATENRKGKGKGKGKGNCKGTGNVK
jgi:hypothetical protein